MQADLVLLLDQISDELGMRFTLRKPAPELEGLPTPLQEFYANTNGIDLPFVSLYPIEVLHAGACWQGVAYPVRGKNWITFGDDNQFNFCLCRTTPTKKARIALWDHDIGANVDATYQSVADLIRTLYDNYREGTCCIFPEFTTG